MELLACRRHVAPSQPLSPGGALPDCPQSSRCPRPQHSPRAPGQASVEVQSLRLLFPCQPREHLPRCSQFFWRHLCLDLPGSPGPGILHLQLPWKEGLFVRGPGLAAQQGGVSQIRGPAPNPACWVLQGSEQLIMNLIKGEREPQSDLGFSL